MKIIKNFSRLLFTFIVLGLVGCATVPPSGTQNISSLVQPAEGNGSIIFYRPNGIFGYGQRHDIMVDGKKVGRSVPGTRFAVDASPGIHQVTVPHALYSGETLISVLVRIKEITYVRTSIDLAAFAGRANVEQMDASKGAAESAGLEITAN